MEQAQALPVFPPEALYGQNVAIHFLRKIYYRRITFWETIPWFQCVNLGAIPFQAQSNKLPAPLLALDREEWSQIRWLPLDYCQVRIYLPASQGKHNLLTIQVPIDDQIVLRNPDLSMTEIHIWENQVPNFEAMNISDQPMLGCRIMAGGYRFAGDDIEEMPGGLDIIKLIKADKLPCKHVWASGASTAE
jgi:hypothetical protein